MSNSLATTNPQSNDLAILEADDEAIIASLTPAEKFQLRKMIHDFKDGEFVEVTIFGAETQRKLTEQVKPMLEKVLVKDTGHIAKSMTELLNKTSDLDEPDSLIARTAAKGIKGLRSLVGKGVDAVQEARTRYTETEVYLKHFVESLERDKALLKKDLKEMDQRFTATVQFYGDMSRDIAIGKHLIAAFNAYLADLQAKAATSQDMLDAQRVSDMNDLIVRFERRIANLEISRTLAHQDMIQIRLMQASDRSLIEQLDEAVDNVIPMWYRSISTAVLLENQQKVAETTGKISDHTNRMLRANAEKLQVQSVAIAQQAERGIVDIDTLKHNQELAIATVRDIVRIQAEGREQRARASVELEAMERQTIAEIARLSQNSQPASPQLVQG